MNMPRVRFIHNFFLIILRINAGTEKPVSDAEMCITKVSVLQTEVDSHSFEVQTSLWMLQRKRITKLALTVRTVIAESIFL